MYKITHLFTYLKSLSFAYSWVLFLLLLIPLFVAYYIWKRKKLNANLLVSTEQPFLQTEKNWKTRCSFLPFALRMLCLAFVVLALARPQSSLTRKNVNVEGIDIVMALDISGSMTAMDFKPNRLEACKNVIKDFISSRPNDRMALVVYAGEAYTQCPLTTDHNTLSNSLTNTKFGVIDDGTAIGDGLGTSINRLKESNAKSKVIILLSDGVNNTGYMDPISAAEIAKNQNIRVYTIGCGSIGEAPVSTPYGIIYAKVEIDETLLKQIAQLTGGQYFRAQNKNKLKEIYQEIDQMEKTHINETVFTNKSEEFFLFLAIALCCFLLEMILAYTVFQIKP